jgi:hypothetical protein
VGQSDFFPKFEKAETRVMEDDKLKMYDLILDRVASEVRVEKRSPSSKYFASEAFYEKIADEIRDNFTSEAEPSS